MIVVRELLERELEDLAARVQRAHRESLLLARQLRDNEILFDALVSAQREMHEALARLGGEGE